MVALGLLFLFVHVATITVIYTFIITSLVRIFKPHSLVNEVYQWVLPFVWVSWVYQGLFYGLIVIWEGLTFGRIAIILLDAILAWRAYVEWKNNDDDRWKRLRKKVSSKVKNIGHRLVVVPDGPATNPA